MQNIHVPKLFKTWFLFLTPLMEAIPKCQFSPLFPNLIYHCIHKSHNTSSNIPINNFSHTHFGRLDSIWREKNIKQKIKGSRHDGDADGLVLVFL